MKLRITVCVLLVGTGCAHRRVPTVTAPPPSPASQVQAPVSVPRAPRPVPQPRKARPRQAPASPPALQTRPPQELQSRTDAAGDRTSTEARLRDVRAQLEILSRRTLSPAARADRERAVSMLHLAQQAFDRGNLRQADELSSRAAMLAKTLDDDR